MVELSATKVQASSSLENAFVSGIVLTAGSSLSVRLATAVCLSPPRRASWRRSLSWAQRLSFWKRPVATNELSTEVQWTRKEGESLAFWKDSVFFFFSCIVPSTACYLSCHRVRIFRCRRHQQSSALEALETRPRRGGSSCRSNEAYEGPKCRASYRRFEVIAEISK